MGCLQRNYDQRIHQLSIVGVGERIHNSRSNSNCTLEIEICITEKANNQENAFLLGGISHEESINRNR